MCLIELTFARLGVEKGQPRGIGYREDVRYENRFLGTGNLFKAYIEFD